MKNETISVIGWRDKKKYEERTGRKRKMTVEFTTSFFKHRVGQAV